MFAILALALISAPVQNKTFKASVSLPNGQIVKKVKIAMNIVPDGGSFVRIYLNDGNVISGACEPSENGIGCAVQSVYNMQLQIVALELKRDGSISGYIVFPDPNSNDKLIMAFGGRHNIAF